MREEDLSSTLTWEDAARPAPNSADIWQDAERHHHACTMLARQLAFKEAGPMVGEYFAKYRLALIAEAAEIIATSPGFARWRYPRC
jgi:hypothetical protein